VRSTDRSFPWRGRPRAGLTLLACAISGLALSGTAAARAEAGTPPRVALPSPDVGVSGGTPAPVASQQELSLRVYLAGQAGRVGRALAVSEPGNRSYGHFLTPAAFERAYGPTAAQTGAVTRWLAARGMTVTAANPHYIAVKATAGQADAAFGTTITDFTFPYGGGYVGTTGGFSVPAALGADVATVTGIAQTTPAGGASSGSSAAASQDTPRSASRSPSRSPSRAASWAASRGPVHLGASAAHGDSGTGGAASGYQCSQYWGQHTETIPKAYGRTTAPTQLCGYTPQQMRSAYGISRSRYTGRGATIAVVLDGYSTTMLADADRYFASHGLPGFANGQYTQSLTPAVRSSCTAYAGQPGAEYADQPEEALDVETAHLAAPSAKVVYVGADCDENPAYTQQSLLDAMTRVTDQHLANVVTESFSVNESSFSPADVAAWNLTFEQGAIEGIGFDFDSGDGGPALGTGAGGGGSVTFPASSPWATAAGGTSLEIGRNGTPVADYPWGDNGTQVDAAGTGYTSPPPGMFLEGSTGGRSTFFGEPAYQKRAVPADLATGGGSEGARRVVPDIAADAGSSWLIGYTGAVADGVYSQIDEGGGTSGASPLLAGLEADAMQADGHPLGFVNPALYRLYRSPAIRDVRPVNPASPPAVIGGQPYFGNDTNYLTTLGEDQPPLRATTGYDDVTGLGTPSPWFVTAFRRF